MKELHDHNCNLIIFCLHAIKEPNEFTTSHTCGKARPLYIKNTPIEKISIQKQYVYHLIDKMKNTIEVAQ
jgi:archaellum component FlaG (FlaF/FlaG flagellin family)